MEFEYILYHQEEGIAIITLNRPEVMNAMLPQSYEEVAAAINACDKDGEVRVLVITGKGRGFCSGDDVRGMFLAPDWQNPQRIARAALARKAKGAHNPIARAMMNFGKPSIASVNGPAVGWGMELALWCDLRIASENARFGELFVRRNLVPSLAGIYLLRLMVGLGKAYELLYTGDIIDAQESCRLGLVNIVVPADQLEMTTRQFALKLAKGAPLAQQMIKEAVRRSLKTDMEWINEYLAVVQGLLIQTEDHHEAAVAFTEKRETLFRGK